jgi:hypothetical protein
MIHIDTSGDEPNQSLTTVYFWKKNPFPQVLEFLSTSKTYTHFLKRKIKSLKMLGMHALNNVTVVSLNYRFVPSRFEGLYIALFPLWQQ